MTITVRHRRLRRLVERLVDREVSTGEAAAAQAHLERCTACRAAARLLVQMKVALRRRAHREPLQLAENRLRRYAVAVAEEGVDAN
jgi:anti-sigma factor RsiW